MSDISASKSCPTCGRTIPADAPHGLCPECLLSAVSLPTETGFGTFPKPTPPSLDQVAAAFPQLEILELIGQGGMGCVFKARQPKLDRWVALKILTQSPDPSFAERFTREGRVLARLSHPNIVAVHDFGLSNGFFYLLLEYVDGVNLRQAMRAGRFTPAQALTVVPRICEALDYAHHEGVLHRDIKPENILLDTKGRVKLVDFGIAKLLDARVTDCSLTASGSALGTPLYMAPEQIEKPSEVDHRADVYSLGVVFYEMLTGGLPLGRFAPPSEKSSVDPRMDEVVFRALEKEPNRRIQSAGEVKTRVETIAGSPAKTDVPPATLRSGGDDKSPSQPTHRTRAALILFLTLLVTGMAWLILQQNRVAVPDPTTNSARANELQPTNVSATKSLLLTRPDVRIVNTNDDTRTLTIWTDTKIRPGESLTALVQLDGGKPGPAYNNFFVHSRSDQVSTSSGLTWFFGGALGKGFDSNQAAAALENVRRLTNQPCVLTNETPLILFSVSNRDGGVMVGSLMWKRTLPNQTNATVAPKPQAIVHVRDFQSYQPSVTYSVILPPGYALRATVDEGEVSMQPGVLRPSPYPRRTQEETQSAWFRLDIPRIPAPRIPTRNPLTNPGVFPSPPQQPQLPLPLRLPTPAQREARIRALEERFQELQDMGPIPVVLGEPYPIFTVTNQSGEIFHAFWVLVGPDDEDNPTPNKSTNAVGDTNSK